MKPAASSGQVVDEGYAAPLLSGEWGLAPLPACAEVGSAGSRGEKPDTRISKQSQVKSKAIC